MFFDEINELNVISGGLLNKNCLAQITELDEADFYFDKYRVIFKTIKEMYNNKKEIGINAVRNELLKKNLFDKACQDVFLDNSFLINNIAGLKNIIKEIKEHSNKRLVVEILEKKLIECQNLNSSTMDVIHGVNSKLKKISDLSSDKQKIFGDEGLGIDRFARKDFVKTGITEIDECVIGFYPSQLITIGSRPGIGKSALALQMAYNTVLNYPEKKVLFFSLEMQKLEIELRLCSMEAEIDSQRIQINDLFVGELKKFIEAEKKIFSKSDNLFIYDDIMTLEDITNECKKKAIEHNLSLVVFDYMQLVDCMNGNNRYEKVTEISREMKLLAKELNVPVVALVQLNRSADGEEPRLSHIRESGSIEQDSNVVIFIHKEEVEDEDGNIIGNSHELIIAKNRNGRTGRKRIMFKPEWTKFVPIAKYNKSMPSGWEELS